MLLDGSKAANVFGEAVNGAMLTVQPTTSTLKRQWTNDAMDDESVIAAKRRHSPNNDNDDKMVVDDQMMAVDDALWPDAAPAPQIQQQMQIPPAAAKPVAFTSSDGYYCNPNGYPCNSFQLVKGERGCCTRQYMAFY